MGDASNAKLMKESVPSFFDFTAATDSGDHTVFTVSGKNVFSDRSGKTLEVVPDGVVTGGIMLSTHSDSDKVTCPAITVNLAGVETTIAATTATITRPATNVAKICSITVTSAGAVAVVAGEDGSTTAFSETRGAEGGPPLIPVGSVERGQVRVTSSSSAVISAAEIFQEIGVHVERFDSPGWSVSNLGMGNKAESPAEKYAHIKFNAEIGGAIHTGSTYRKVYVKGYSATFAEIGKSVDFKPIEDSYSASSTQIYGNQTVTSSSTSTGQGGFTGYVNDGISDELSNDEGDKLIFKFYPDRMKSAYSLTQGKLGIATSYPANNEISIACTLTGQPTVKFSS